MGIGEFLIQLSDDSDLLARFREDPYGVMADGALSEKQQELVMSGDVRRIREELQREYPDTEVFVFPAWNHIIQRA